MVGLKIWDDFRFDFRGASGGGLLMWLERGRFLNRFGACPMGWMSLFALLLGALWDRLPWISFGVGCERKAGLESRAPWERRGFEHFGNGQVIVL